MLVIAAFIQSVRCLEAERTFCPSCRADLPPSPQLTASLVVEAALQQQAEVRASCNSFFLEVVSRFCLSEDQSPSEEVVELLFSLLISARGDVYKTRELSPFLECVDNSPVVRSVLPKLLLQYSFDQVKGHIQRYLKDLEDNVLQVADRTELYLLFVNCFQRSSQWQQDCRFLSRLARRQTPTAHEDPAEFLLDLARLRLCLATAAHLLHTFTASVGAGLLWQRLSMVPLEVDQFLVVSPLYQALRDGVALALLEDTTEALQRELQKLGGTQAHVLLALALFRQVTCRYQSPDLQLRPSPQVTKLLEGVLRDPMPAALRAFCTALLSNHIGAPASPLSVTAGLPSGRRALLELLVHQDSVLLSGSPLLAQLHQIAFQTAGATQLFLPTMPDDHMNVARQWMSREKKLVTFVCANGHLCFVGEAVRDMVHPTPRDVVAFLWSHLERDVATLGRALDVNADDTAVALHLILAACTAAAPGDH
ncbi:hypothetical protein CRUP_004364 [Coryphaenoides rupestris]|nr:hypothetical protein CRUP_004364 [Coryphaenoides rupestris]